MTGPAAVSTATPRATARLSTLDRLLPIWIFLAMALGLALGRIFPGLSGAINRLQVADVSLPIALGLLWMMYPVLARVQFAKIPAAAANGRMLGTSLVLNWVIGPAVMFALAWLLLPDQPAYRTGLILVGLARCIAMVLIWNLLACGDNEYAAVLVALNSVFQIFMYAALGYLYLTAVPHWLGGQTTAFTISTWQIARSVLIFLGIPLVAGFLTRL
ncbi:MAG TPA: hypothetical protein VFN57_10395, partial [Thermomicrobiaceae bacterium]|nr:hypothetical protein [Thermomicrobiaceae bacterium]